MPHQHTYTPQTTTMLTLPTRDGVYEVLILYRCPCGACDAYDMAIGNRHRLPSWAEIRAQVRWQQAHPTQAREPRRSA